MLTQLEHLANTADGRFATAAELQFLKDYLATVPDRVNAYETIREAHDTILDQVDARARALEPLVFQKGKQDCSDMYRRDRGYVLKWSAASMLFDDLDRLRDGLLLWHRTILKAVKQTHASQVVCQVMPQVIDQTLPAEVAALLMPALQLDQTLLG